jgi:poly [ADP-ribose] polymerase
VGSSSSSASLGIDDPDIADLISRLMDSANEKVARTYKIDPSCVSVEAIAAARSLLTSMARARDISMFNQYLERLFVVIPRKVGKVADEMAKTRRDMACILSRETDNIDVLEGQVAVSKASSSGSDGGSVLDAMGIKVWVATDKQRDHVMAHLNDELRSKVKGVYRVINEKTQARFDDYLKSHGKPRVKEFWHGSRTQNWISIMRSGLVLNPDAKITGKMFGSGIYFAPSAQKSFGYTSYNGSYWAKGDSDSGFMGLYATAYGEPYVCDDNGDFNHSFGADDLDRLAPGKSCVHAKAGKSLRNDEIVFYDEAQMTINYIVEFA